MFCPEKSKCSSPPMVFFILALMAQMTAPFTVSNNLTFSDISLTGILVNSRDEEYFTSGALMDK